MARMLDLKFEGLILGMAPYQDNHGILTLLLPSGLKVGVVAFGMRSSKKAWPQLGTVIRGVVRQKGNSYHLGKYQIHWGPEQGSLGHRSLALWSFICEVVSFVTPEGEIAEETDQARSADGLYTLTLNALYYIQNPPTSLKSDGKFTKSDCEAYLLIFLGRVIDYLGIRPQIGECQSCQEKIAGTASVIFDIREGGVLCSDCYSRSELENARNEDFFRQADESRSTSYFDISSIFNLLSFNLSSTYREWAENVAKPTQPFEKKQNEKLLNLLLEVFFLHSQVPRHRIKSLNFIF